MNDTRTKEAAPLLPAHADPSSGKIAAGGVRRRIVTRLLHAWFWLSRGMTLGVRVMVLDAKGRVFLVRHTYVRGWHLPGGGVEAGQTLLDAVRQELAEEANIALTGPARLHGVYFNRDASRRDHVALFIVRDFRVLGPRPPDREIAEAGFFPLDGLPDGTTGGTRRRLAEVLDGLPPDPFW